MLISRRDFLRKAAGSGVIFVMPTLLTSANLPIEPINISSYNAQRQMWMCCDPHGNLPKLYSGPMPNEPANPQAFLQVIKGYSGAYPLPEWPELKKLYPGAFRKDDSYGRVSENTVERDAHYVVELELASRATKHFLSTFQKIAPSYKREDLEPYLYPYVFSKIRTLLYEQKEIPYNKETRLIVDHDFIDTSCGMFTGYTENEAKEILQKIAETPPEKMLEVTIKRMNSWKR